MRRLPKVCRHLHLPVQSGSSRILAAMRRRYTRDRLSRADRPRPRRHPGHRAFDRYDRRLSRRDGRGFRGHAVAHRARSAITACSRSSTRRGPTRSPSSASETMWRRGRRRVRIVALQGLQREIQGDLHRQAVGPVEAVLVDSRSRRRDWELSGRTSGNTVVNFAGRPTGSGRSCRSGLPPRTPTA